MESVRYGIAIERSTSGASERTSERIGECRRGIVSSTAYCDWDSMWYKRGRSYQVYQRVVFTLTHLHPRKTSSVAVPGYTFPPRPFAGERRQANTPTIHPSPLLSGSQPGVVYNITCICIIHSYINIKHPFTSYIFPTFIHCVYIHNHKQCEH